MGLRSKKSRLDQATDIVEGYVESVRPHVTAALESARESTRDFVQDTAIPAFNDAKDKAGPALADARGKAAPVVAEARVKAAGQLADAREKAAPVVAVARVKAAEHLADVREKAAPVVAAGAAAAGEKATAARELADAKVAQVKGEEPKKKSKLKRFLLLSALAGAVAFAAKKLQGQKASDNWQSSYVPTPAPAAAAAPAVEDTGGASPDEALADEAETPHPVTTPDEPAEVIEIDHEAGTDK